MLYFSFEPPLHFENNENYQEETKDANHNVKLGILLSYATSFIRVFDCHRLDPLFELIERTSLGIFAKRHGSFFSVVNDFDRVREVIFFPQLKDEVGGIRRISIETSIIVVDPCILMKITFEVVITQTLQVDHIHRRCQGHHSRVMARV